MNFNEEELMRIKKATSGIFKGSARRAITAAIEDMAPRVAMAKQLTGNEREKGLKKLMVEASDRRKQALADGADGYGDRRWASAAVCETWLHELALGTEDEIEVVERLVDDLRRR